VTLAFNYTPLLISPDICSQKANKQKSKKESAFIEIETHADH